MDTGHKIAFGGIVVGAVVTVGIFVAGRIKEQERAKPKIGYVSVRYENGNTILTIQNESPVTTVVVTRLDFEISDVKILARISRVDRPAVGDGNTLNDVGFIKGHWTLDGEKYVFSKDVGYNIPAGKPNDFSLSIINPKWNGETFVGNLIISFSGDPPDVMQEYQVDDVMIKPKSK